MLGNFGALPFGHFGAEEPQFPKFVSTLQRFVNSENALHAAYTNISTLAQIAGPDAELPVRLLVQYNLAREVFLDGIVDWLEARKRTPDLPDADKEPTPPPALEIPTPPISGFGQATVPASSVRVIFGPVGAQKVVSLGDAQAPFVWSQHPGMSGAGLGVPWVPIIWLAGLAIFGVTIVLYMRERERAEVIANASLARQSESHSIAVEFASRTLFNLYEKCVGDSLDEAHRQVCLDKSHKAVETIIAALPKPIPPKIGLSFLGKVGAVLLAAAAGVGVYLYYQKRKER
ncbi:hypothetical protein LCGC14_0761230 [marine sediment metagenome]|uniref:Uncharacterized protein n=1 Tax=marine sediment metagenome TaxID=412755 RepID=A0A0F9QKW2_9ZZZZ